MTSGERVVKNLIEGINRAFGDLPTLVRALERHAPAGQGVSFANANGLTLTIGDRTVAFSGEGRYVETVKAPVERTQAQWKRVKDERPMEYAKYCRGEMTEEQLFAVEETSAETKKQEAVKSAK